MKSKALFTLLILLISGCGPLTGKSSFDHADISTPSYLNLSPEQHGNNDLWWHQFNDPQLNNLIEQLFRSNITLRIADARLKEARANLQISNSELLPWLNITGNGERNRTPSTIKDVTGNNHRLQAVLGYEIDLWNKLGSQRDAAQYLLQFSDAEVDGLYLSLTAQFTTLYFSYQQQQQHYEIVKKQLELRQKYRDFIHTRYRHGLEQSRQIYSAEQAVDLTENEVQTLKAQLTSSEHALALLLGIRRHELKLNPPTNSNNISIEQNIGIPADLILRRPDVVSAWNKFYAADAQRAAAIAERLPTISLQASIGLLHNTLGSTTLNQLLTVASVVR
jgi:multidrug efflux system outer membrane protein